MDTALDPRSLPIRKVWILSWLAALLAVLFLTAPGAQTQSAKKPAVPAGQEKDSPRRAWDALTGALLTEYYRRHPDLALQHGRPGKERLALGTFGTEAAIRWKDALEDAKTALARLEPLGLPPVERARHRAFEDWVECELLLLDAQASARNDPSSYVKRVIRVLSALDESDAIPGDERPRVVAALLAQLPAYWSDAEKSLVAPCSEWIELALRDLDDLLDLVERVAPSGGKRAGRTPTDQLPPHLASIDAFRHWLLDMNARSGSSPKRLGNPEWTRLTRLSSGTTLARGEIKARCLRDLAASDPGVRRVPQPGFEPPQPANIVENVWTASSRVFALAQRLELLDTPLAPEDLDLAFEASARTATGIFSLRAGKKDLQRAWIELPSPSWSNERASTRLASLLPRAQVALGVRYGLVGEALVAMSAHADRTTLAAFSGNPALREGFGLYALGWVAEVGAADEGFLDDPRLAHEFALLAGLESARLLCALEQHAEGVSLTEAQLAFRRRTGVDADTARAEALEALREPRTGIGILVRNELRALEHGLTPETGPRAAVTRTLEAALRHPELRPADLRQVLDVLVR